MVRVFDNGLGDLGSIPGRVIPKTQKMVLDASLLNTQHYKVRIKGKVEQSWEKKLRPPLHLDVVAIEKGTFGSPSTNVTNFTYLEFKAFCKPTCKNGHIHFYSNHNTNTKRGIIIGFYFRSLRIFSTKYEDNKFDYIENYFLNLLYPKPFIQIANCKSTKENDFKPSSIHLI